MHITDMPLILKAKFDNADVAFALGHHNFPDFRKNLERAGLVCLPRIDENPARPKFRIAHIYEYALSIAVAQHMTRESTGVAVRNLFDFMRGRACDRLNKLDNTTRRAIIYDGMQDLYLAESAVKAPVENGWFVDYPWLAFEPALLDRSPERMAKPVLWVAPPPEHLFGLDPVLVDGPALDVVTIMANMTKVRRGICLDPDAVESIETVNVFNMTALLSEVDRRLDIRLAGRRLRGET